MDLRNRALLPRYIARHPANQGHVGRALARSALFQARARLTGKPALAHVGSARVWVSIGDEAATKVIYGSPPDYAEMRAWERRLRPGDAFVDVGANVGTYSLWAAQLGCRVLAIEPDPGAFEKLTANAALNPELEIECLRVAITNHEGRASLTTGRGSENRLGEGQQVDATTLGTLVTGETAGVKIDVEGFERLVLDGAAGTLAGRRVACFQLEWNGRSTEALGETREPVARLLEDAGYELMRPDDQGLLCDTTPDFGADVFAVRT